MRKTSILVIAAALLTLGGFCLADAGTNAAAENTELKARIEKLEKELADLKEIVNRQEEARAKEANNVEQRTSSIEQQLSKTKAEPNKGIALDKIPVLSGLDVELYGRLKLDAVFDTSRMDMGNYAKWVRPDRGNNDHTQFDMTPNESRLGMSDVWAERRGHSNRRTG